MSDPDSDGGWVPTTEAAGTSPPFGCGGVAVVIVLSRQLARGSMNTEPGPARRGPPGAPLLLNNSQPTLAAERLRAPFHLVRGGFQPRLPTSLPPPGQQQQPSPLPRRQPVPLMPPAQLHPGAPQVVAPAPAVPLQSPPPSELMDVDPSAGPPSQAVAVQPVLQPLSLGAPKESDTAAPCPAPTQQPSTQRQETLPLFVGPDAPSRPVPEAAPVVTGWMQRRLAGAPAAEGVAGNECRSPLAASAERHVPLSGAPGGRAPPGGCGRCRTMPRRCS
ncbi:actin cytoskeleton-regulatory complex protein PAN1-like [Schistocerca americana]|uniref:actin cytoskeleton-regulatory complex protein PAN1-like n=1 Tax=Schistocerca americana TaxID=7009 RepID=UPI001F50093D|nr:actin cytoskeleton-regulatory complex protein PAN1-like [Schistocerca americana]